MDKFAVGEIAITQNSILLEDDNKEVEIVGLLAVRPTYFEQAKLVIDMECYAVREDGVIAHRGPNQLRKRPSRGDMDTVVSWADCPWQPKEVVEACS